ncbi:hypothetical protein BH09MYX1_BH09MYX1_23500 [soil metagenome]
MSPHPLASPAPVVPPPLRPRVWPAFVGWVAAIAGGLVIGTPFIVVVLLLHLRGKHFTSYAALFDDLVAVATSPLLIIAAVSGNFIALSGVAILAARWTRDSGERLLARLALGPSTLSIPRVIGASLGSLGISVATSSLIRIAGLEGATIVQSLDQSFAKASPLVFVVLVALVGVAGPLSEELLFRGFMQPLFRRRWGPRWGIALSALAFGITHVDPIQATFAFVVGIYLGWLTESSRSLRPAIASHVVNNTTAVILSHFATSGDSPSKAVTLITGGVGIVLFVIAFFSTRQLLPPVSSPPRA